MKRTITLLLTALLLVTVFAACGVNLSSPKNGTYKSEGLLSQTWTFSGTNNVSMSTIGGLVGTSGTYTINGENLSITASLFGVESTSGYTITEITSKSFFIDGTKFTKQ